jgi:hypothetical protein
MIEGKGLGNKKVNRVGVSLTNEYDNKLRKLATSCGKKHTELAGLIIERCLDDTKVVDELQELYCLQKAYKVVLINKNGRVFYVLTGREDI